MTSTLSNFVSALTQGNEDSTSVTNGAQVTNDTPSNLSVDDGGLPANWDRVWQLAGNASQGGIGFPMWANNQTAPSANHLIASFYLRFSDLSPATGGEYLFAGVSTANNDLSGNYQWALVLETDGDCRLIADDAATIATATTPFTVDTWHRFDIRFFPNASTGEVQVWVDGTDIFSGNQTSANTGTYAGSINFAFQGPDDAADGNVYVTGGLFHINSTHASDRLDSDFGVIGPYGDTAFVGEPSATEGVTPDVGDDLDRNTGTGDGWNTTQNIPFSDEGNNDVAWYDIGALAGAIYYDAGSRSGPSGDSRIDGASNIKGWKGTWRLQRGNGSGTTHTIYLGDDSATWSSGFDSTTVDIGTSMANYYFCTDVTTNMPTTSDNFAQGFGKDGGGRGILCGDMTAFVLHVPATATTAFPFKSNSMLKALLIRIIPFTIGFLSFFNFWKT